MVPRRILVKFNLEGFFFECVDLSFLKGSTAVWSPGMKYVARFDFDENVFCRAFDPTDMSFGEEDLVSRKTGELESVDDSGLCHFKPANWLPPLVSDTSVETVFMGCLYREGSRDIYCCLMDNSIRTYREYEIVPASDSLRNKSVDCLVRNIDASRLESVCKELPDDLTQSLARGFFDWHKGRTRFEAPPTSEIVKLAFDLDI
jgi:hypothetical protein